MNGRQHGSRRQTAVVLTIALLACEGAEVTVVRPLTPGAGGGTGQAAFTIALTPPSAVLSIGSTTTITAVVRDSLGNVVPGAVVTWVSGNAGIASVTAGVVTGVAAGTASIGASYSGVTATASILVVTIPVASVQVIPAFDTVQRGTTAQLTAVPKDANGLALIGRTISWQTNNPSVAGVSGTGLVNATAVGSATITAISEGQIGTSAITVVHIPVATVTVSPPSATVYVGRTLALTATTFDAGNNVLTGRVVTWTSSAPAVASVSASGVVAGVAAGGPVTITATSEGQQASTSITVTLVPVATVTVLPSAVSVAAGATTTLTATARDSSGATLAGRPFTWASSDSTLATISSSGVVGGVTPGGPVTITATTGGMSGTSSVTVTVPPPTLVRVLLSPDSVAINAGATQAFTVQGKMSDSSLQAISVTYTAAGGTITQGGMYAAGSTAGTFSVIARVQSGTLADTSKVTVVVPPPAPVATVTVAPGAASVPVGATQQLTATTRDAGNNILTGRVVTWSSADTTIARVNASGVVTGVALGGPVSVTATSEGQTGTSAITVVIVPVATVQVSPASASVAVGATTTLTATTRDAGGNVLTGRVITWTTGNGAVAGVNGSGVVNGVAAGGPVPITATSEGKTGTANVTVTGAAPTLVRVILLPDTATMLSGSSKQFAVSGKMSDSSVAGVSVAWSTTGGIVSQNGVYSAPGTPGVYSLIATAQGTSLADTSRITVVAAPPPGTYTLVVGNDWQSYPSSAALVAANLFYVGDNRFSLANNLAIVPDAVFGQVARITQPADTSTQPPGMTGWTPRHSVSFTAPIERAWYRFRVRWSPGWTTVGPYPIGSANSYKLAFIQWESQYSHRAEIEFSNTSQYLPGYGFPGISCTTTLVSGSQSWGNVTTEWSGGEWWEFIMYYERLAPTHARGRFWRRQLTSGGVVVNNPFVMIGEEKSNCSATISRARGIALGANKNKTTPVTQYIYWGPYEVVDGTLYPNPFGVGP